MLIRAFISLLFCPLWTQIYASSIPVPSLSSENIQNAARYSFSHGGTSLIVSQRGHRLLEAYAPGISPHQPQRIYSGTKSFWALSAAKAENQGILRFEEKASETLPEWKSGDKKKITLAQLLNMTSGLFPAPILHGNRIRDRNAFAMKQRVIAPPGDAFHYGPASLQVLNEVAYRKLQNKNMTPRQFLEKELMRPLGIPLRRVVNDRRGIALQASGFTLTAREWQRLGECLSNGGTLGLRRILPKKAIERCLQGSRANPMFGFGFWLNQGAAYKNATEIPIERNLSRTHWPKNGCISRNAPPDLFAAVGSYGQRLYIIPSKQLVVVRQGNSSNFSDAEFLSRLFKK